MFYADQPEVEDRSTTPIDGVYPMIPGPENLWWVTETDSGDEIISQKRIAMPPGATAQDAIAALQEATAPPSDTEIAAQATSARIAAIKSECSRRILAVLDIHTTSNITGAVVAGELSAVQVATFQAGRAWVASMQATSRALILDPLLPDHTPDMAWPLLPAGVADLAAQF